MTNSAAAIGRFSFLSKQWKQSVHQKDAEPLRIHTKSLKIDSKCNITQNHALCILEIN